MHLEGTSLLSLPMHCRRVWTHLGRGLGRRSVNAALDEFLFSGALPQTSPFGSQGLQCRPLHSVRRSLCLGLPTCTAAGKGSRTDREPGPSASQCLRVPLPRITDLHCRLISAQKEQPRLLYFHVTAVCDRTSWCRRSHRACTSQSSASQWKQNASHVSFQIF